MRYYALATDYDGTIASDGCVPDQAMAALLRLRDSGRKLILVTGRELPDLFRVFPHPEVFDRIVAENGAVLFKPATREERSLAEAPPRGFAEFLRREGVTPLSVGRVIVATFEPNDRLVLRGIRELGLELQVIFNKGAVMVLPSGVNKATGLAAALEDLALSPHNVVGVGDAENDHAFLDACECSAAVANALPALKARADLVLEQDHGAGVMKLVEHLLEDDLRSIEPRLTRHAIRLGTGAGGRELTIAPCGSNWLVAGNPHAGKSTLVEAFLEKLFERGYQACVFDSAGAHRDLAKAIVYGKASPLPTAEGLTQALQQPQAQVVVDLAGAKPAERPGLMQTLLSAAADVRRRFGRPHWIVLDEAHALLAQGPAVESLASSDSSVLFVTAQPERLPDQVTSAVEFLVATGETPVQTMRDLCARLGVAAPALAADNDDPRAALLWTRDDGRTEWFVPLEPSRLREERAASLTETDRAA